MTSPIELGLDNETYSSVPIKLGADAYASSPDFEILLISYKFSDEDDVKTIDLMECGASKPLDPEDSQNMAAHYDLYNGEHKRFWEALTDPEIIKTAYNANFERTTLARYTGHEIPPQQWRCTMILASQMGLPRSLADVGAAMGLKEDEQKSKTGKALITYFSLPCKPTIANGRRTRNLPVHAPEKWELYKEYNRQDVVTEQVILSKLRDFRPDQSEQDLWTLDQIINDRGVALDLDLARKVVDAAAKLTEELTEEARELTGLDNPTSPTQLKDWLKSKSIPAGSLAKDAMEDLFKLDLPADVRRVLRIRQSLSKTSVVKYKTALEVAAHDGRARGMMQFYGGHTGRWAGRGLQPQNLARNTMSDEDLELAHDLVKMGELEGLEMIFDDPMDVFSQLVRTTFIPSEGNRFVVTDFSAIEARVIAWVAGENWRTEVFKNGGDIYCESASRIYHVPVVKHGENGHLRQRGKVAELALGYGGGVAAMVRMDTSKTVPQEEMQGIVDAWRKGSPKIPELWRMLEKGFKNALRSGNGISLGKYKGIEFKPENVDGTRVMSIILPSGRPIRYWDPKIIPGDKGDQISFMNQDQTTKKWARVTTWGGTLCENVIQSIARDCLGEKMKKMEELGYKTAFHVHDELVLDVPKEDTEAPEIIDRVMGEEIGWAAGLPLKGGTYECEYYRKD